MIRGSGQQPFGDLIDVYLEQAMGSNPQPSAWEAMLYR